MGGDYAKHQLGFNSNELPDLHLDAKAEVHASALQRFAAEQAKPILFVAESAGRREVFDELLRKSQIHAKHVEGFAEYTKNGETSICVGAVQEGMVLQDAIVVCESQVLGTKPATKRRENGKRVIDPDQIVRNLTELSMGAPVVHVEHGWAVISGCKR